VIAIGEAEALVGGMLQELESGGIIHFSADK